ncbi:hypothetical protein LEP1GSC172_3673 [Leptospira noguchii]|uniref:Uncharacterized protein n=1 Tax=Leptospira noguchii TaxID=28182 RepID=M6VBG8_9LEPT|nr:hypothetical protein LEP1GSC172_3673 [Leptospira noguchii]
MFLLRAHFFQCLAILVIRFRNITIGFPKSLSELNRFSNMGPELKNLL